VLAEVIKVAYERMKIPIFGTGVGPYNDTLIINFYDMLGLFNRVLDLPSVMQTLREI